MIKTTEGKGEQRAGWKKVKEASNIYAYPIDTVNSVVMARGKRRVAGGGQRRGKWGHLYSINNEK